MGRPKKVIVEVDKVGGEGHARSVKKTLEIDYIQDRYLKVAASLQGLSDSEYIRQVVEKSITQEVRNMVDKRMKDELQEKE